MDTIEAPREAMAGADLLADNAPVMLWMSDAEGHCLYLNRALRAFWDAPPDLSLFDWSATILEDDKAAVFASFQKGMRDHTPFRTEGRYRRADGAIRVLQTDGRPRFAVDGAFAGMIGVNVDVTDARFAEAALRESEGRFRLLADSAPVLMWVSDRKGSRTFVNEAYVRFLGRPFAEALTFDWKDRLHPEDALRVRKESIAGEASRAPFVMEARYLRADGAWRWLQSHSQPRWAPTGDLDGFVGVAFDITEAKDVAEQQERVQDLLEQRVALRTRDLESATAQLKLEYQVRLRAEQAAKENAQHFRRLVNSVVDYAIYMLDASGNVATWNAGAERIKGYTAEEIIGAHFSKFYTPEDCARDEPANALHKAATTGKYESEAWRLRKDGSRFWCSIIIDPIFGDNGEIIGYAKVTRDISARLEAQRQLEQAREALFQAQKMEAVGQLTGGIAHDFNNMLAGVIGALHLLQRKIIEGKYDQTEKYLQAALGSADRAASLTARLLAFGRRQALDIRAVDVNAVVGSMADLLHRTMGESITIALDIDAEPLTALTDAHQLESAILNLAINARDAMPVGGALSVRTGAVTVTEGEAATVNDLHPGRYVCLKISDTGQGMSPEVLSRAFEPFFTTKPQGQGTGLGLAMIFGFAKQVSGAVQLESEEGHGTTVSLYLPATASAAEPLDEHDDASPRGAGETVLVVEDDPSVRMLVVDLLTDLGYNVLEASDSASALPIIEGRQAIDLLVTDIGLPGGMNGRQIAEIAQRMRPEIRVLLMTGYAETAALRPAALGPKIRWISKPFQVEAFAARVSAALQETD